MQKISEKGSIGDEEGGCSGLDLGAKALDPLLQSGDEELVKRERATQAKAEEGIGLDDRFTSIRYGGRLAQQEVTVQEGEELEVTRVRRMARIEKIFRHGNDVVVSWTGKSNAGLRHVDGGKMECSGEGGGGYVHAGR